MDKHVVLKFGESSLGQEFPVTLSVGHQGTQPYIEVPGRLPSDPELYQLYATWATAYRQLGLQTQHASIERSIIDVESCRNTARLLSDRLNLWLHAKPFRPIQTALMAELDPSDDIQLLIQTANVWLRRLPWHLWELERAFPGVDPGLMAQASARIPMPWMSKPSVHVLVMLSCTDGIDVHEPSPMISVPNADISFLLSPGVDQFYQALTAQSWDIVFLSGQRPAQFVGETGRFYLNSSDSLAVEELSPIIETAAHSGLQVLVMNSWDGMAIAPTLEAMAIPHVVTMREPAPTCAAYHFFKTFLTYFANGTPFYRAIRKGRQSLDQLDAEFPCVSWLPIVCQQSTVDAPLWQHWNEQSPDRTIPPLPDLATGDMTNGYEPSVSLSAQTQPTDLKNPLEKIESGNSGLSFAQPFEMSASQTSRNLIHHRYQIRRVLGRGGFGRTYLAADTHRFDELCVLKQFIPASRSESSLRKARELFQREAKVLYQIDHPQIPKFLAWFTHDEDLFIVQEYVDGQSYFDLLRDRQHQDSKTFSEQEIIRWLRDLVPVLGYIHSIGIVHRDISPANIMFSNAKQKPILIDFGVVKEVVNQILSGQYSTFAHPPKATLVGKPGYSPPEQIQLGDCFPCSDFYSLGMTAVVLLTGQDARLTRHDWRQSTTVSEAMAHVIERMLAERPKERYQSAQAIMSDLGRLNAQNFQAGSVPIPPPPPPLRSPAPGREASMSPRSFIDNKTNKIHSFLADPIASGNTEWEQFQTPALSAQFLAQCQHTLAEYIGPVASFAIEDILSQASELNPRQFLSQLADEIPNPSEAQRFQKQIHQTLQTYTNPRYAGLPVQQHSSIHQDDEIESFQRDPNFSHPLANTLDRFAEVHSTPFSSPVEPLSSAFIARCRHELALCIGPMANFIVDDVLEVSSTVAESQFIEAIAAEIPNDSMADAFRQRFQ